MSPPCLIQAATPFALAINWDAAAVVVSGFGLLLVVFSLWQVKRSLDMSATGNIYGSLHNIHLTFIEHPKLRPYFYHNLPLLREEIGDEEYFRARAIAEMFLDTFEHIFSLQSWATGNLPSLLVEYVRHMCASSPFLRAYLLENAELLHPTALRNLVEREERKAARRSNSVAPNPRFPADA